MLTDLIVRFWPLLLALVGFVLSVSATLHAVLKKRDIRAVIGWVGLIWLAPIVGAMAYFCLGVNRLRRKALSLHLKEAWNHRLETPLTEEDEKRAKEFLEEHPALAGMARLGKCLTEKALLPGNRIEPLVNGDEAYPLMLEAIDGAKHSVAMLSYIFDNDPVGKMFQDALVRAQDRGVEVRVLIDHVGSRYTRPTMVEEMSKAGLSVRGFLPTRASMLKYANLRNHRKILVVDGQTGFTGGTNIRLGHWLAKEPGYPVQCLHFLLEGPVVSNLQEAFVTDWAFASGESLTGETWFPRIKPVGLTWARGLPDGPDEDFEVLMNTMVGALAVASKTVWVVTPYFLPDSPLIHALNVASMRGVEVNIVVPAENNLAMVQWASTAQFNQLLEKGCRIHLTPPPFDHTKVMIVDSAWSLIGSTNWDPRSLRLNFEYNVECYDMAFAATLEKLVKAKLPRANEVTLDEMNGLSFRNQLRNGLARLWMPYL